jgi:hypothetical protein
MVNWNQTVKENEKSSQQAKTRGGLAQNQGRDGNQRPMAKKRTGRREEATTDWNGVHDVKTKD